MKARQVARQRAVTMPNAAGPAGLAAQWRADAATLRRRGAGELAVALETCAEELATWARAWELEALTLEQAARESGFAYSTLQHLVADGRVRNAGSARRPRIRRTDLPRKPGTAGETHDLADRVLAARQRKAAR
jgi:hypothetical protein